MRFLSADWIFPLHVAPIKRGVLKMSKEGKILDILTSRDELDNSLAMCFDDPENILTSIEKSGINMNQITDKLLFEGVESFADSFDKLIVNQGPRKATAGNVRSPATTFGSLQEQRFRTRRTPAGAG